LNINGILTQGMDLLLKLRFEENCSSASASYVEKFIASIYYGTNVNFFSVELGCPVFTIYSENTEYCIKWNNKNNILAYSGDDKNNHGSEEGNVHLIRI
jgi:hypothetical protein